MSETVVVFELWTLEEAAQSLRVSSKWLQRSQCPFVRLGRLRRYDPRRVAEFAMLHRSHEMT